MSRAFSVLGSSAGDPWTYVALGFVESSSIALWPGYIVPKIEFLVIQIQFTLFDC